jgi:hypothetical protein
VKVLFLDVLVAVIRITLTWKFGSCLDEISPVCWD